MTLAYMRVLAGVPGPPFPDQPLEVVELGQREVICVAVPGFGHVIVATDPAHPNADWAMVSNGPGTEHRRPVTRVDGRIECEMLHKADRLCVVIEP